MAFRSLDGLTLYVFLSAFATGLSGAAGNVLLRARGESDLFGQICDSNQLLQVGKSKKATNRYEPIFADERLNIGARIANEIRASVAEKELFTGRHEPTASHEYCESAFNDTSHVFHGMWSHAGILDMERFTLSNGRHAQKCWEGMRMTIAEYFSAVRNQSVLDYTCERNWRAPQADNIFTQSTSMILGNDHDILAACGGNGDCQKQNMHMLFLLHPWGISHWNMCRNFEFVSCGAMGGLPRQDGGLVYLATAPKDLKVLSVTWDAQVAWMSKQEEYYSTPPITLLEVCLLDQMCSNYDELFAASKGQFFRCNFDEQRFFRLQTLLG